MRLFIFGWLNLYYCFVLYYASYMLLQLHCYIMNKMGEKLKAAEVVLESKVVLVVTLVITSLDFFLHFLITIISMQLNASNMFDRTLKQKKSMKRRGQHWLHNLLQKPRF